jgi:hypothetical protein
VPGALQPAHTIGGIDSTEDEDRGFVSWPPSNEGELDSNLLSHFERRKRAWMYSEF